MSFHSPGKWLWKTAVMSDAFLVSGCFLALAYSAAVLSLARGILQFPRRKPPEEFPNVSVIVCAYNEEEALGRCLESLDRLDYPRDKLEILLVDDESDDRTRGILEEFARRNGAARVLSTSGEPRKYPGKQRPLELGIRHAKGGIILVTDADCAVEPSWVKEHVAAYGDGTGIVGAVTGISTEEGGIFAGLQDCDLVSKLSVSMGCAGLGFPLAIMGNNMSFRREAYEACGGFEKIGPTMVEDADLMYAIHRDTPYGVGWVRGNGCIATSRPLRRFGTFLEQRWRMLHVARGIPLIGKVLIAIEILMSVFMAAGSVYAFRDPRPVAVVFATWLSGGLLVLTLGAGFRAKRILCMPGILVFQLVYGLFLCRRLLFGRSSVTWKGRMYDRP